MNLIAYTIGALEIYDNALQHEADDLRGPVHKLVGGTVWRTQENARHYFDTQARGHVLVDGERTPAGIYKIRLQKDEQLRALGEYKAHALTHDARVLCRVWPIEITS
jgi:hypothetical protein